MRVVAPQWNQLLAASPESIKPIAARWCGCIGFDRLNRRHTEKSGTRTGFVGM